MCQEDVITRAGKIVRVADKVSQPEDSSRYMLV